MTANELRVGNFVRIRDNYLCVKAITDCTLLLGNNAASGFVHDAFYYADVQPIELTSQILEKIGFSKSEIFNAQDGPMRYWANGPLIDIEERMGNEGVYEYCGNDYIRIVNLHQLQNLYFALTGKELEINLTTPAYN